MHVPIRDEYLMTIKLFKQWMKFDNQTQNIQKNTAIDV